MTQSQPNVYTIASCSDFLDVLAREILRGFPCDTLKHNIADLTVLLPTRRAARELQDKLLVHSSKRALLLPRIVPIGDVDEDVLEFNTPDHRLNDAISSVGRQFTLVGLLDEWLKDNAQNRVAREMQQSPQQVQALAASLGELIDSLETEEISLEKLAEAYAIDLASHQQVMLGLLDVIHKRLPAALHTEGLMGAHQRRSKLIALESQRLKTEPMKGPVIAAGSTGTIPATRELLKTIAGMHNGALVLPGLDQMMDRSSWESVTPQHPQYALKELVTSLGMERMQIKLLGPPATDRAFVASELMRPSEVADQWRDALLGQKQKIGNGLVGVSLLEARDKNEEASIIALVMRRELETPEGDIALVTPDRDLARRVKAALQRWNIAVDDSAGEPLIRFGAAALLSLVMDAVVADFSAPSLVALFAHPLSSFGWPRERFEEATRNINLILFRNTPLGTGLKGFDKACARAISTRAKIRQHAAVARLSEADWSEMELCVQQVIALLSPLDADRMASFTQHFDCILEVAQNIAGDAFWEGPEAETLSDLVMELRQEGHRFPYGPLSRATTAIYYQLHTVPHRLPSTHDTRLSILGLLEARLMRPQTIILGGLNEGKWPRQPDAGPWLNRTMRDTFAMPQPERQIGQMAHDFVQAFSAPRVYLTTARRDGMTPAIPSRWLLRLATIMQAVGLETKILTDAPWRLWGGWLDEPKPAPLVPCEKPLPRPPVTARPKRLSVTRIEKLIRDPYAIYAETVLQLQPLPEVSAKPDVALRGTLYHAALGDFFGRNSGVLPPTALADLMALGQLHFEPYLDTPEIAGFWWSRFRRIAQWVIENEPVFRGQARNIHAEVTGALEIPLGASTFTLSARADRIDIFPDGTARIIDFKSGQPPSSKAVEAGFSPQLTLQAAMLEQGAFKGLQKHATKALTYIRISGGVPAGEVKEISAPPQTTAQKHLANLITLLNSYNDVSQPYVPRFGVQHEEEETEYDHLSRYREWMLAGVPS